MIVENHVIGGGYDTCPNCGYCPSCGRGGRRIPYNPYPYPNPWTPMPYTPTWTDSGTVKTTATFEVRN